MGKEMLPAAEVELRVVKQAVAQARPDNHAQEAVDEQGVELFVAYPQIAVLAAHHVVGGGKAKYPPQRVVAYGESEEVERLDVGVPVDVREEHIH